MMAGGLVEVEDRAGVRRIRLNDPEALNAMSRGMFDGVRTALAGAADAPEVACVVLSGNGRAFTAGMDLRDDGSTEEERSAAYDSFIETVESFPKPLIASVGGVAVGIGTTILGHCDIVVASTKARFRVPFTSLGLVPEAGSTVTLPSLLGVQVANHALFTGSWISAEEAERAGLVWRLVDVEALDEVTDEVSSTIAAMPVSSLIGTKRLLLESRLPAARASREREEAEFRRLQAGPDHAEALAAFREGRKPDFSGAGGSAGG